MNIAALVSAGAVCFSKEKGMPGGVKRDMINRLSKSNVNQIFRLWFFCCVIKL